MSFYDQNELIAFPLVGDDDNQIPEDLLVDCIVHAPSSLGTQLQLKSISVTTLVVSIVLAIDGVAVAYLTSLKDQLPTHQALPITPIATGVSGFIAFGEGVTRTLIRADGAYKFLSASLISFEYDTSIATVTAGAHPFYGLVKLIGANGISITGAALNIRSGGGALLPLTSGARFNAYPFSGLQFNQSSVSTGDTVSVTAALFSADTGAMLDDPLPGCFRSVEGRPLVQPITSINGVVPDCSGNLTLEIVSLQQVPTSPVVTVVDVARGIVLKDGGAPCV